MEISIMNIFNQSCPCERIDYLENDILGDKYFTSCGIDPVIPINTYQIIIIPFVTTKKIMFTPS
jgi:hypothetical protein